MGVSSNIVPGISLPFLSLSLYLFLSLGKSIKKLVWKGHKSIRVSFWRYFFLLIQETFCLELRINCDVIQWSCCSTFSLELFLPPKGLELRRQCRCILVGIWGQKLDLVWPLNPILIFRNTSCCHVFHQSIITFWPLFSAWLLIQWLYRVLFYSCHSVCPPTKLKSGVVSIATIVLQ